MRVLSHRLGRYSRAGQMPRSDIYTHRHIGSEKRVPISCALCCALCYNITIIVNGVFLKYHGFDVWWINIILHFYVMLYGLCPT